MWYRFVLCTLNPMLFILPPLSLQSDHISFERSSAFQYIFVPRLQFFSRFRKFSVCVSYFVCQGCLELCLLILGMIRLLAFNEWNQTKVQWREEALPSEYNVELRRSLTVAQSYTALPRISFLFPTYSRDARVMKRKTRSFLSCEQRAQHACRKERNAMAKTPKYITRHIITMVRFLIAQKEPAHFCCVSTKIC